MPLSFLPGAGEVDLNMPQPDLRIVFLWILFRILFAAFCFKGPLPGRDAI